MNAPASHAPRYSNADHVKAGGATYTPIALARFVARHMLDAAHMPATGPVRVLDPACGDGALLSALLDQMPPKLINRVEVVAVDIDQAALASTRERLRAQVPCLNLHTHLQDFLAPGGQLGLFDLVIANPPYVRTQVMGAARSADIANRFGLTGRVDLYYPFMLAIAATLKPTGTTGIITSNRFMTTRSGQQVRRDLLTCFDIEHIWDLGDTKLFDAAVLPAVLLAHNPSTGRRMARFSTIYQSKAPPTFSVESGLEALDSPNEAIVRIADGRVFQVRHGVLDNGGIAEGVWRIRTQSGDQWLAQVNCNTWGSFSKIGKIKVGVKSTADKVFIRSDWDQLPSGTPELLRPLVTRKCARRYRGVVPGAAKDRKKILYPHIATPTGRAPVNLDDYPVSKAYLESHRAQLESRSYVIQGGRNWFEIWVPHDPAAWSKPKLVFPDIAEKPVFWMEHGDGVVNGECYWMCADNGADPDLLWLALAVANSSFIEEFYDRRFNNKLYAGRRRFVTQYVEQFPLPDPQLPASRAIIDQVKNIYAILGQPNPPDLTSQTTALDAQVWKIFGLPYPAAA